MRSLNESKSDENNDDDCNEISDEGSPKISNYTLNVEDTSVYKVRANSAKNINGETFSKSVSKNNLDHKASTQYLGR